VLLAAVACLPRASAHQTLPRGFLASLRNKEFGPAEYKGCRLLFTVSGGFYAPPLRRLMVRETNESVEMFSTTWLQFLAHYWQIIYSMADFEGTAFSESRGHAIENQQTCAKGF
jgi:hypothetical protein